MLPLVLAFVVLVAPVVGAPSAEAVPEPEILDFCINPLHVPPIHPPPCSGGDTLVP